MNNEVKVRITYPKTGYTLLNQNLIEQLNMVVQEFISYQKILAKQNICYTLHIKDEQYSYKDYISYVFYISIDTGGAHPNNIILTINYDRRNNEIITIDSMTKNNDHLLNDLCIESRKQLKSNKNIAQDQTSINMMLEGTKPEKNNFKNFIFGKDGLIVYFQQYQIAPYASGVFQTVIPYTILDDFIK